MSAGAELCQPASSGAFQRLALREMSIWLAPERPLHGGHSWRRSTQRSRAMRFLCLVYFEPEAVNGLSPQEKTTLDRDSMAYDEELRRRGYEVQASSIGYAPRSGFRIRGPDALATGQRCADAQP